MTRIVFDVPRDSLGPPRSVLRVIDHRSDPCGSTVDADRGGKLVTVGHEDRS